jgi:hypothetical protein
MEELSLNNVNTVENTELLDSEAPVVNIDPEILPPTEIQNQVVLFDGEFAGSPTLSYIPFQQELQKIELATTKFEPVHYASIYEPEYTQTQNEAEYIVEDLSNAASPDGQNQVVLFNDLNGLTAADNKGEVANSLKAVELKNIRNVVVSANGPTLNALAPSTPFNKTIPKSPKVNTVVRPQHE